MLETITLAGGCFWCLEAVFLQARGVYSANSGYMGGRIESPTYEQICRGDTGHAEVVQVTFDPLVITRSQLLDIFFAIHDPTTLNRQGHDVGTQYRSAIFASNEDQIQSIKSKLHDLKDSFAGPIVTEVLFAGQFWPAEVEHHDYYSNHPHQPYCRAVVEPKLRKFLIHFPSLTK
nr:peptide-methionine (S)-S-oxide reductase MsrA [uncultured Deefgea sp.]